VSEFWIGNLYLSLAVLCTAASQVTLKALLNHIGYFELDLVSLQRIALDHRSWQLVVVAGLLIAGSVLWVLSLRHLHLSYAYSIACGSAFVVALLSMVFLNESVSPKMWVGIVLIVAGTLLLIPQR
jgi:multidrug transporter EmrE-like cation transporter